MIININKPINYTSRDIVNIVGKTLNTRKCGHTGTLDPIASGVLIICTDEDTKLVELLTSSYKEYIATFKLGIETDTFDITGNITKTSPKVVDKKEVINTINSFQKTYLQTPPIYSAIKINGKKLYEYARTGKEVTLPQREVTIKEIEVLDYHDNEVKIKTLVSKGTYIRSLIKDIGDTLGTYATMTSLVRTKQGSFSLEDSISFEDLSTNNFKYYTKEEILPYKKITLNEELLFKVKNGNKISLPYEEEYLSIIENSKIIAIYHKDNTIYRAYKMFHN